MKTNKDQEISDRGCVIIGSIAIVAIVVVVVALLYGMVSTAYTRHITTADEKLNQIRYETTSGELYRVVIFPDGITCYTIANERAISCTKN